MTNKLQESTRGLIFVVGVGASRPYFRQLPRAAFCAFPADVALVFCFGLLTEFGLKQGAYRIYPLTTPYSDLSYRSLPNLLAFELLI